MIKCVHKLIYERGVRVARETKQAIIERLTAELEELNAKYTEALNNNIELMNEVTELNNKLDDNFSKSNYKKQLEERLNLTEQKLKSKEHECVHLIQRAEQREKYIHELIYENERMRTTATEKKHNERGAGRKRKLEQKQIELIKMYRAQGMTYKQIAEQEQISVGLVHKLINEK